MLILWKGCPWPVFPTVLCFFLPVLPKFEVIFEAPNQIYALDKIFPLRVCGRWEFCLEGCPCVSFQPVEHKMARQPWGAQGKFTTLQLQEARIFHGSCVRPDATKKFLLLSFWYSNDPFLKTHHKSLHTKSEATTYPFTSSHLRGRTGQLFGVPLPAEQTHGK